MDQQEDLLKLTPTGLSGPHSSFHIDAWGKADINLITHAHSDHARIGSREYWCTKATEPILRARLGFDISVRIFEYGQKAKVGDCWISFHPAGHILGSAQVRIEHESDVWVVTGDYKRDLDPTCTAFEVVPCDTLITEATFALPIYDWQPMNITARQIFDWWNWCKEEKLTAILFCYALGKSQRVLAELMQFTDEEVLLHGAVTSLTQIYRDQGIAMLPTVSATNYDSSTIGKLVLAPPSAHRSPWMKRFPHVSTAFASGWMAVRGIRRRRGYERGFVLSDHADWKGLIQTIDQSGAKRVLPTHGSSEVLARYLVETRGLDSHPLKTNFGEEEDNGVDVAQNKEVRL
jgi:putative mRNA 3-end processing factor